MSDSKDAPASKRRKIEPMETDDGEISNSETLKEKAINITQEFVMQKLTVNEASEIVIEALVRNSH
jgi:hypothetical protein